MAIFVLNPRQAISGPRHPYSRWRHLLRHDRARHLPERVIAGPFCTRQPMYSLGCFGARQFMKITGNEMWFGVPIDTSLPCWPTTSSCCSNAARTSRRRWMSRSIRSMSSRNTSWMYRRRRAS